MQSRKIFPSAIQRTPLEACLKRAEMKSHQIKGHPSNWKKQSEEFRKLVNERKKSVVVSDKFSFPVESAKEIIVVGKGLKRTPKKKSVKREKFDSKLQRIGIEAAFLQAEATPVEQIPNEWKKKRLNFKHKLIQDKKSYLQSDKFSFAKAPKIKKSKKVTKKAKESKKRGVYISQMKRINCEQAFRMKLVEKKQSNWKTIRKDLKTKMKKDMKHKGTFDFKFISK